MKLRHVHRLLAALLLGSLNVGLPTAARAQTVMVSNITEASYLEMGTFYTTDGQGESFNAQQFTTGPNASYFNSLTLHMDPLSYNWGPGAFNVKLYTGNLSTGPSGTLIATLSGPLAPTNGYFDYTSSGPVLLDANTTYSFVTGTRRDVGNYVGFMTTQSAAETSAHGWSISDDIWLNQGSGWRYNNTSPARFTINGSAIPEPSTYAMLAGLGALGLAAYRRRRTVARLSIHPILPT